MSKLLNRPQLEGAAAVACSALLGHGVIGTLSITGNGKYEVIGIIKDSIRQIRPVQNLNKRRVNVGMVNPIFRYASVDGLMINVSEFAGEFRSRLCPNKIIKLALFINPKSGCVAHCDKGIRHSAKCPNIGLGRTMTRIVRHNSARVQWPNDQAQAQAREMMPRRSREAANLPRRPKLKAQRLLPAAIC